ncbi:MAG: helix-turn-helix domain-containing protein [Candidatus Acidiferrales bacterium]
MHKPRVVCTLKQTVKRRGLSLYKLRQKSGISYPTIWAMYHNRTRMLRFDTLEKLCRALGCLPKDLLRLEPVRFPRLRRIQRFPRI